MAVVGTLAYLAMTLLLRSSGKRTLSKMNAFDVVVSIALGSILATVVLAKDVALADGTVAFSVLIGWEFVITWSSVRSSTISRLVKSEPTLLLYQGQLLPHQMRRARVVEAELTAAVRAYGIASLSQVAAVVLETDGSVAVVRESDGRASALGDLLHQVRKES